jgi:hypothetical protein
MKIFAVRWPDGSFSVTLATGMIEAIEEFDKVGDTNGLEIREFDEFLATFRLSERGELELQELDHDTRGEPIAFWAFPIWAEALGEPNIEEATKREIARKVLIAPKVPLDPDVRALSREMDLHPDLAAKAIRAARQPTKKK